MVRSATVMLCALALSLAHAGCATEPASRTAAHGAPRAFESEGLRVEVPAGWDGFVKTIGPHDSQPLIWVANVPFAEGGSSPEFPHATFRQLPADGIVIEAIAAPAAGPTRSFPFTNASAPALRPPLTLADGYFLESGYEGQPASHISTQIIEGRLRGRSIYVQLYFGTTRPSRRVRARASDVLASVTLEQDRPRRVGSAGVTVRLPDGWHTTTPNDGNVTDPLTRFVVASAPIRPERRGCQVSDYAFPSDAVALVVVEWLDASVAGGTLPPRPDRLTRAELPLRPPPSIECFDGPGGSAQFADRGRRFGAYLLLGRDAPAELADAARAVLDSLRVQPRP